MLAGERSGGSEADSTLGQFMLQHRWHIGWGIAAAALICWSISSARIAWMSPIIIGLVLSAPPVALLTAKHIGNTLERLLATTDRLNDQALLDLACGKTARVAEPPGV